MKETQFQDIKKVYPHEFVAKKIWICYGCHRVIQKGTKYRKARVNAHMPYSKGTLLKPLCVDCCEEAILRNPELLEKKEGEQPKP